MCGISGFIDYNHTSSNEMLRSMNRTLAHRGPDGEGYFFEENNLFQLGLGHRRLSIIDLTNAGHQPMIYKHLTIVFNGEMYNYAEVKNELVQSGHTFESHSDTEVILHAFEEWGSDCIHKFIGMFAFVIFNQENRELYAFRDRAGVKPFYYYFHQGLFLFASELKAIVNHSGFDKKLNLHAVASFLNYAYVPAPHCIYDHTLKLKPGHFLHIKLNTKELSTTQYWNVYDYYNKPKLKISLPEAIDQTEKILQSAFNYRMVSDVPVGVFLSGGYDSTTVTALLQKESGEKIKTFTIGVPDAGLNEAPYAKEIAAYLGTDHTEFYCTQKEALDIIPTLPFYYDEPFADSSAIPTMLVSKIAREKVIVALSADAGDEIFAGYGRYDYMLNHAHKMRRIPAPIRSTMASLMHSIPSKSIPFLKHHYRFTNRYDKLKTLLKDPSDYAMMMSLSTQYQGAEIQTLFREPVTPLSNDMESKELKPAFYDPISYMMAIDYQTYLPDDILQKVDRAGMSVSLEGREPFLDQRVIEFAAQLPTEFKYRTGNKKYILKQIAHKYVPEALLNRPKMGFGIPVAQWLEHELKPLVDTYLSGDFIRKQQIFNEAEIDRIKQAFYQGRKERAEKIWYLLMFQMWYEKWMM